MKTYELTIETEKGRKRNAPKVVAQGPAASATDFYNQHLKELIEKTQGWDSSRCTSRQVGGPDSITSTVYPDDQPIKCDKTGEWTAAPAGNANHEFDPDYVPPRKTYVSGGANDCPCCGEPAGMPGGGVETGKLDAAGNPIEVQCEHPAYHPAKKEIVRCPFVLGDKHCGVDLNLNRNMGSTCDKTFETCRDRFKNEPRFGGFLGIKQVMVQSGRRMGKATAQRVHAAYRDAIDTLRTYGRTFKIDLKLDDAASEHLEILRKQLWESQRAVVAEIEEKIKNEILYGDPNATRHPTYGKPFIPPDVFELEEIPPQTDP